MTVFVSYSSRDRDAVKTLAQDLQDADEQVWLDQRLAGGDAWWRAILEQVRGCDVFIFALSQNSIDSKPCQAELHYAQALGLSILPVQVGPVDSMQLNPLATVQTVDYRSATPGTAMRLTAALHRERARRQPLPSALPDEPPVPFEYLIRLYTTIAGPDQLSPRDQAALVAQLQVGLREDGQHEAARKDIVMLLGKLHDREDVTYRTRTDVDAILASIGAESPPPPPAATDTTAVEYPILDHAAKAASETVATTEQLTPASARRDDHVRPMQPPAPDAVWQQPAYLYPAATHQRPPGWAPVPPPRPAHRPAKLHPAPTPQRPPGWPPEPNFSPKRPTPWWRRKAIAIPGATLAIIVIAISAVVLAINTKNVSAYRASVSASASASLSTSMSASAATSRVQESQRQQSLTTRAVHTACETLETSSKDAINNVNAFVAAYNAGRDTAPSEGPAIDSLNHSADLVAGSISGLLSQELREQLNAYADAARDMANAIRSHEQFAEFNQRVNQVNDTKTKAVKLCLAS